jgi:predicted HD superfamily hydrolase involved in NAD metabolism
VAGVSFDTAVLAVRARLGASAAGHSLRVAETAGELAETYGVDVEDARLAGLLHDWDRERPSADLLEAAREAGVAVSPADEEVPYLLHARTGAAGVKVAFPDLPSCVVLAVERHTVGSADMSPLDMVVYLADMIEPNREYRGVDKLRAAVGAMDLSELFALGYRQSVLHLIRSRKRIHPDTVAVWNSLVAGDPR